MQDRELLPQATGAVTRRRSAWLGSGDLLPGLFATLAVAAVASALGRFVPLIGGPVFAIVLGVVVATVVRLPEPMRPGFSFAGKRVLQASIVLLGTGLSLSSVVHAGARSLPVMLGTLAVALSAAFFVGRFLRVDPDARLLIGVGTGICGASAIAAVTSVITLAEVDVAYAIGTIFVFNVAAVLLFPPLGHLLGLSQHAFGLWAGTAVNDTSSVVATSVAYGASAANYAVVVKLTRSLMIVPICATLAAWQTRRRAVTGDREGLPSTGEQPQRIPWHRVVPMFIVAFVAASAVNTVGGIPASWHPALSEVGVFFVTVALAGIGLGTRISVVRRCGLRPLLLGGLLWVLVGASSLALQAATGGW